MKSFIVILMLLLIIILYNAIYKRNSKVKNCSQFIFSYNISNEWKKIIEDHRKIKNYSYKKIILKELHNSFKNIINSYRYFEKEYNTQRNRNSSIEWILDNMYLVKKEYNLTWKKVKRWKNHKLPCFMEENINPILRISVIAKSIIDNFDNLDEEIIKDYLTKYQQEVILTNEEIRVLNVILKIEYFKRISKICIEIVNKEKSIKEGETFGNKYIVALHCQKPCKIIKKLNKEKLSNNKYFWQALIKTIKDNGENSKEIEQWIKDSLKLREIDEKSINILSEKSNVKFSKAIEICIVNIKTINTLNWIDIFQKTSRVEEVLIKDPAEVFQEMDFHSKEVYRDVVEEISLQNNIPEILIAYKVLQCAKGEKCFEFEKHIGYYLVDKGRVELNKALEIDFKGFEKIKSLLKGNMVKIYLLTISIIICIILLGFQIWSISNDRNIVIGKYILATFITIIPISEIVISIINWSVTYLSKTRRVCKLSFKKGIPEKCSTGIVIPTIVSSIERGKQLVDNLEKYYLGNKDKNLYYILLGDFIDSNTKDNIEDEKIVKQCNLLIGQLNEKYCKSERKQFFFLCRERRFNNGEGKWIGWERKRGKIEEFNKLIRGSKDTSYNFYSSDIKNLENIKYIITLDADTILPINSAKILVGTISHPLNKAYVDMNKKVVWRGYGVIQPRISISLESANSTYFSKIFSGNTGIDIYTTAVSDIYQDLFGEGIYTGKAIYDVDVFNCILEGVIKENTVLSHDLLEGSFLRTALLTDIELIDSYPSTYIAGSKRLHRWVRGDWQLLPWLWGKNNLNKLSKWKIIDNLRRSLVAPSMMILLICSLINIMPDGINKWYMLSFIALITPILFDISDNIIIPMKNISLSGRIDSFYAAIKQVFFLYAFLPFQSYLMIDAIIRSNWRIFISKRNRLQWQTAEDTEKLSGKNLKSYLKYMWGGSLIGVFILVIALIKSIEVFLIILPSGLLWIFSPLIAYTISKEKVLTVNLKDEEYMLRRITRKTYAYFEDFIGEETNYLGPDNFQEEPFKGIAMRTSPTNIGLGLISNIVAVDMGYLGVLEALDNIKSTLDTMGKLETYEGHYFNWYDIKSLKPIGVKYISTVDSGNLIACLYVLIEALKSIGEKQWKDNRVKGLKDTVNLAIEEMDGKFTQVNYLNFINNLEKSSNNNEEIIGILEEFKEFLCKNPLEGYWNSKLFHEVKSTIRDKKLFLERENETALIKDRCENIIRILQNIIEKVNFSMLYNYKKGLFHIGYDVENKKFSENFYDLLASEARTTSYIAIARGEIPMEHWFNLGRSLTQMGINNGLASWSGTMFEYYMPRLIFKNYKDSLWDETYRSVVSYQIEYCNKLGVPFGISESGYYHFDLDLNYQYKAFGVPNIGIKPGLREELVISPYSTIMALLQDIPSSIKNMNLLINLGMEGKYGFYEAVDYTKLRVKDERFKIVKSYMIHHLGMSLLALDNIFNNNIFQRRFHNIPIMKAYELLLQEKTCKNVVFKGIEEYIEKHDTFIQVMNYKRNIQNPIEKYPKVQLLSNGRYNMMIEASGSNYSKYDDTFIYRWREDITARDWGMFFYINDLTERKATSTTFEPRKDTGDEYKVEFYPHKASFKKWWNELYINTEIYVLKDDDCEIRTVTVINNSDKIKEICVTSYCEIILQTYSGDLAHPAFGNLFITTEYIEEINGVIANRRPRSEKEKQKWILQRLTCNKHMECVDYETSRLNFIGRNNTKNNPEAIFSSNNLKKSVGIVLDPIIALRGRVKINPKEEVIFKYISTIGISKEKILEVATKYDDGTNLDEIEEKLKNSTERQLAEVGINPPQIELYETVASYILYLNPDYKKRSDNIKNILGGQNSLWKYGISGDLPIIFVIVDNNNESDIIRQVIQCDEYLRKKGLKIDLIILNNEAISYEKPLQYDISQIIFNSNIFDMENKSGGIFVLNKENTNTEDVNLIKAIASIVLYGNKGSLWDQILSINEIEDINFSKGKELKIREEISNDIHGYDIKALKYFNGFGGFNEEGEYVITLKDGYKTPAPWINVVSNDRFGFHISESGSSYTWYKNSREFKITPWNNDFVQDTMNEVLYLKDEEENIVWSITPEPIRHKGKYIVTHGFGYSKFEHNSNNVYGEMTVFAPLNDDVKIIKLKLRNKSNEKKKIAITYYANLAMGTTKEISYKQVITAIDKEENFIYGINKYAHKFSNTLAFLKILGGEKESFTGDRNSFMGMTGTAKYPMMLELDKLNNRVGAGQDSCLCSQVSLIMDSGEEKDITIILGAKESIEEIYKIIEVYKDLNTVSNKLIEVKKYWKNLLETIEINTPDESMNLMINGWLMYQTISCRIFSRSAFYQSGGAVGFRDQLQDVIPVIYLDPIMTRKHILYAASRQFEEGDVQHWWHPVTDSGIRTRFSDDLLWLPYVVSKYIKITGDYSILEEKISYLKGEKLKEGEEERYDIYKKSELVEDLYQHCIRAIEKSMKFGAHNLPLMGTGDWNDGMNCIGNQGKGESVWLAWFLYSVLDEFIELCNYKKDFQREEIFKDKKKFIKENVETNGWDGEWYRRAYFDDGTPLGSKENKECNIDSLSQCWSVISGAGDENRKRKAMKSLEQYLIKEKEKIILLLTPPFKRFEPSPGYIKGYVEGVRENGGQYTHGATWVVLAYAILGEGNKAFKTYSMLNPINHTDSKEKVEIFKNEPYVMSADVYSEYPNVGRGGWSWYTGSSAWMYTIGVNYILGFKIIDGKGFKIEPCIPDEWNEYSITYKTDKSKYLIKVSRGCEDKVYFNGRHIEDGIVPLEDGEFYIHVTFSK